MRILLPSNASKKFFPNNTLARYTVELPQPINLSKGSWEVALVEIQFNKSWYNVKDAWLTATESDKTHRIPLADGYYSSNELFIRKLNEAIKCHASKYISDLVKFYYDDITRRCSIRITFRTNADNTSPGVNLDMSPNLKAILNMNDLKRSDSDTNCNLSVDEDTRVSVLESVDTMRLNLIYNIMVYCDLAEPSIVGDTETPLLRVIPVKDEHWQYQCTTLNILQYIPIKKQEIRTISIELYTDYGEIVPFTTGRTIVTLELRRVRPIEFL